MAESILACVECGARLWLTPSRYGVCPNGHGKLIQVDYGSRAHMPKIDGPKIDGSDNDDEDEDEDLEDDE